MLRACALKNGQSWDKNLSYAEFSYNNSYQASLKMSPFEAYMDANAEHHYSGIRLERVKSLDPIFSEKLNNKYNRFEKL